MMVVDTLHSIQVVVKADVWYIAAKLVSVSHFSIYSVFMDIHNSFEDIHNSFMDIHNSFKDIHKSFMDIRNSFKDIHK